MASVYAEDDKGKYIPATQRPDGTWRKARRVKEGYVPQEEVPKYESKGKQLAKERSTFPIGLSQAEIDAYKKRQEELLNLEAPTTKKKHKKKKKKTPAESVEALQEQVAAFTIEEPDFSNKSKETSGDNKYDKPSLTNGNASGADNAKLHSADPSKRIRNLRKKLRQIDELMEKVKSGELVNLSREQEEKIERRNETEAELRDLEAAQALAKS